MTENDKDGETEEQEEQKLDWKWGVETIWKSALMIIIIFLAVATMYTVIFENTYCKIERDIQFSLTNEGLVTAGQYDYKSLQQMRNTENGYYKTIYGLGMERNVNETNYNSLDCKMKIMKRPLLTSREIKEIVFEGK